MSFSDQIISYQCENFSTTANCWIKCVCRLEAAQASTQRGKKERTNSWTLQTLRSHTQLQEVTRVISPHIALLHPPHLQPCQDSGLRLSVARAFPTGLHSAVSCSSSEFNRNRKNRHRCMYLYVVYVYYRWMLYIKINNNDKA